MVFLYTSSTFRSAFLGEERWPGRLKLLRRRTRTAASASALRHLFRLVAGARGSRPLRRDQLHGGAAAAGDRHPDGLGARTEQILRLVLGQGLALIATGVIVGAVAALWLGRFLAGLVFGVGTTDPLTFGGVALLLATTALLASTIPALRAARLDPASVLRSE